MGWPSSSVALVITPTRLLTTKVQFSIRLSKSLRIPNPSLKSLGRSTRYDHHTSFICLNHGSFGFLTEQARQVRVWIAVTWPAVMLPPADRSILDVMSYIARSWNSSKLVIEVPTRSFASHAEVETAKLFVAAWRIIAGFTKATECPTCRRRTSC